MSEIQKSIYEIARSTFAPVYMRGGESALDEALVAAVNAVVKRCALEAQQAETDWEGEPMLAQGALHARDAVVGLLAPEEIVRDLTAEANDRL